MLWSQYPCFHKDPNEQNKKMRQNNEGERQQGWNIDGQIFSDMPGYDLAQRQNKGNARPLHSSLISFGSHRW